jgi:hypothetical protein
MKPSLRTCPFVSLLGGMAIGAALAYLLDFDRGVRRRAQLCTGLRKFGGTVDGTVRDVRNKLQSPLQQVARLFLVPRQSVPDWVVAERTRLETWRTLAHPGFVHISVHHGRVTLWGPVLVGEPERLRSRLVDIPGIRQIELQLLTAQESTAARHLRAS